MNGKKFMIVDHRGVEIEIGSPVVSFGSLYEGIEPEDTDKEEFGEVVEITNWDPALGESGEPEVKVRWPDADIEKYLPNEWDYTSQPPKGKIEHLFAVMI